MVRYAVSAQRCGMDPNVGLCSVCVNVRPVENMNGSVFYLCELALVDRRFRKYPPLPVIKCEGFEPCVPRLR